MIGLLSVSYSFHMLDRRLIQPRTTTTCQMLAVFKLPVTYYSTVFPMYKF